MNTADPATSSQVTAWDAQGNPIPAKPMPVTEWDAQGNPIPAQSPTAWDAEGNPVSPQSQSSPVSSIDPQVGERAFRAAVYGNMLSVPPGYAYLNFDTIDAQMRSRDADFDKDLGYAAATGWEETPLGMLIRGRAPDPFESHDLLHNFVHDVVGMATDPAFLLPLIGFSLVGMPEVGVAVGGFLDAGLREGLMDHYEKGDVKSFKELTDRASDILWSATKGGLTSEAMVLAGDIPVGRLIGRSAVASYGMKGLYQASAMTAVGSLLDQRIPRLEDFTRAATAIVPLNLATGGLLLRGELAEQALRDVYAKEGASPEESAAKLAAQPHDPLEAAPGLRPAIKFEGTLIEGNEGETHSELVERIAGQTPVDMDQLEANPDLADRVLQFPNPHLQEVIDKAWKLKAEELSGEALETIDQIYDRRQMKSGRGFLTPDDKFLSREQARAWVRENQPAVAEIWQRITGERNSEFHADDYAQARERIQNRTLAEGEPDFDATSPTSRGVLAAIREDLNKIKAGNLSDGYAKNVLRTLFVGQRDVRVAIANQLRGHLQKLLPDYRDQEALSFLRDYKGNERELSTELEAIRSGSDEELKKLIPSIERALNPSPQLLEADRQMTAYYAAALNEGRELGFLESGIPADRYVTHVLAKAPVEEARRPGRPRIATRTPYSTKRQYATILDALKTGQVEARTVNALDALSIYGDRHATAAATKLLTTELKNSELGKWGSREQVPSDWQQLAPQTPGFSQIMTIKDAETGESFTFSRGLYVPKIVADAMRPILERNALSDIPGFRWIRQFQSYVKSIELGLSVFHMKALSITAMNNMSFADFAQALKSNNDSPEFEAMERTGAEAGLTTSRTSTPYEAYKGLKPSSFPSGLDVIRGVFPIKQIDALSQALTHETFDVIQRKFKVMDFSLKSAAWLAKNPDAGESELFAAQRSIAKEVNAAYGGLNWEVLGFGRNALEIARAFILAPDWTFSNVFNLKYTFEGGPGGNAARMFWIKSFTTGIALTQAMSLLVSGQLSDHATEVYLGQDKDGKKMYANWFFAGAPKDAITWLGRVQKDGALSGTAEFLSYKLGPIAGTALGLIENKNYQSKPIYKKDQGFAEKTGHELGYAVGQFAPLPFSVKNLIQMLNDPDKTPSYVDFLSQLAGVTVMHEGEKASPRKTKGGFRLPRVQRTPGGGMRLPGERRRR